MPRLVTFVDDNTLQNIKDLSEKSSKPVSKIAAELVELGYKVKALQSQKQSQEDDKMAELEARHTEYLIRILTTVTEILACVCNEKSQFCGKDKDAIIDLIKTQAKALITGYVGKD